MNIPRSEHPMPQFKRDNWINLNGLWYFEIDNAKSGRYRGLIESDTLNSQILVPFCPESSLSGIGNTDYMYCVWYKRDITLSEEQISNGNRIFLHFGACDYETEVWINNEYAGKHIGGYASFKFDITAYVKAGVNKLTVCATDEIHDTYHTIGKQSRQYAPRGCHYTRTTGIWQTVWLEIVPDQYIKEFRFFSDAENNTVIITGQVEGQGKITANTYFEGRHTGSCEKEITDSSTFELSVSLSEQHLWDLGKGNLYDVKLSFNNDVVYSYFGLRSIKLDGKKFLLNGRPVFQRLVLDQGYYPDGIYTAPDDEALQRDIILSMQAGFNGARLHQKVFESRFLYHCDRLGYMVWAEYGSWGMDHSDRGSVVSALPEWLEVMKRDYNHPSIIGWCPLNETWDFGEQKKRQNNEVIRLFYIITKLFDPTRPCIDTSGNYHVLTDIFDVHDYTQDVDEFRSHYIELPEKNTFYDKFSDRQKYNGEPVFVSEFGGIGFNNDDKSWCYGDSVKTKEEFYQRYEGLVDSLLDNPSIMGFCYTQLYDVEQERNGLYTYERQPKVDIKTIMKINQRKAAIEA